MAVALKLMPLSINLSRLARPYILRELPGWGRLFKLLKLDGIDNTNPRWRNAPTVRVRGKLHGYLMDLDLSDDLERATYFLGRYYDRDLQTLLDALLRRGDTFIDIGANVGMMTLHGASRVTERGRVISFEPQPICCRKIKKNLMTNGIHHVTVHNVGLSDQDGEMTLAIPGGGTIMAYIGKGADSVAKHIRVPIRRGDDLVNGISGKIVIKIDVEGYELYALRGLINTLRRHRPPIISELNAAYLERAGTNDREILQFFRDLDYDGYEIAAYKASPFHRPDVRLKKIPRDNYCWRDADFLWLPANERARQQDISRFIV